MFDICHTGPKVISKTISISSIDELASVLCRPPVIWDNLHANDYDQRLLFLGPYEGRSSELIPRLNGVLTNPNCEYGANYVAIHTLSQWSKCGPNHNGEIDCLYDSKEALSKALNEWINIFHSKKRKTEDYNPAVKSSYFTNNKPVDMDQQQPDCVNNGGDMMIELEDGGIVKARTSSSASSSDMDTTPSHENSRDYFNESQKTKLFSLSDLHLIVDYFYLPHSHGDKGQLILNEFNWLKCNAPGSKALKKGDHACSDNTSYSSEEAGEVLSTDRKNLSDPLEEEDKQNDESLNNIDVEPFDNDKVHAS